MTPDVSPSATTPDLSPAVRAGITASLLHSVESPERHELPGADVSGARTLVHIFEPVRDEHDVVIDFRLNMSHAGASDATRGFDGIRMAEIGPSVAPGEALWMLKQVFASGERVRSVTRHVSGEVELVCQQTAMRNGDFVVTTTTLWSQPVVEAQVRAA